MIVPRETNGRPSLQWFMAIQSLPFPASTNATRLYFEAERDWANRELSRWFLTQSRKELLQRDLEAAEMYLETDRLIREMEGVH